MNIMYSPYLIFNLSFKQPLCINFVIFFHKFYYFTVNFRYCRPPDQILEVEGPKFRGLNDIFEVGKMSLDALENDIKASSLENIH